jgi:hypothetical protein
VPRPAGTLQVMNADVLLTIAFVLYAVLIAVGVVVVSARNRNEPALDEAAEQRFKDRVMRGGPLKSEFDRSHSPKGV